MVDKYKGPERRKDKQTRRTHEFKQDPYWVNDSVVSNERRAARDYGQGRSMGMGYRIPTAIDSPASTDARQSRTHAERGGIVEFKEHTPSVERRMGGAGRRAGDLSRALKTGESVVFQAGKGALAKKVLGKAGKLGKLAVGAITVYDMVSKQKQ